MSSIAAQLASGRFITLYNRLVLPERLFLEPDEHLQAITQGRAHNLTHETGNLACVRGLRPVLVPGPSNLVVPSHLPAVPLFLRTKLIPELEAEDATLATKVLQAALTAEQVQHLLDQLKASARMALDVIDSRAKDFRVRARRLRPHGGWTSNRFMRVGLCSL